MPDGRAYLAMEYLDGESLSGRLKRVGRMSVGDAVRMGHQMAGALAAAHAKKVVHRDLKPANVMVIPEADAPGSERIKLVDFGIAKLSEGSGGNLHTRTGALMGTPVYMSPEQCRGSGKVDDKSDVYSLGIMFFQMLVGAPPVSGRGTGRADRHAYVHRGTTPVALSARRAQRANQLGRSDAGQGPLQCVRTWRKSRRPCAALSPSPE